MPRKRSVNTLIVTLLTLVACAQPAPSTPPGATVPGTQPNETVPVTVPAAETPSPLTLNLSAPDTTVGAGLYVVVPLKLQGTGAFSAAVTRLSFDPAQLELVGAQSGEGVLTSLDEPGSESRLLTVLSPTPAASQTVGLVFKLLGSAPAKVDVQALQLADEQNRLADLSSQASFSVTPGEGGQAEPPALAPFETQLLAAQRASGLSPQATTPPITVPTTPDATWTTFSLGDLDQNNKVDLADLTLLSRFLLAKQVPTPYQAYASDLYDKVVAPATSQVVDTADLVTLAAKVGLILLKKNFSFPSVHPLSLSANSTQGGLVVAGNGGNGPLSVTTEADQPWIKVQRLPDNKDNVLLNVTADAPVGQTGNVTLTFAGGVKRIVKVTALAPLPNPNQIVGQFGATLQSAFSALTFTKTSASSPLELSSAAPVWDPASHVFTSSVTVKNTGTLDLPGVKAVIRNPNPTTLRPINPSGYASDDAPFIEFGPLAAGQSQILPWRLYSPEDKTGTFTVDLTSVSGKLTLTTAGPASFSAAADTVVTVRGADIRAETAFFIESTKLVVQKWSENSADVVVPKGFPVATYGLMAANPSGDRAVLYPAFSVTAAPAPPVLDPKTHARSFVDGYVTDIVTRQPIAGATVSLPGLSATTNDDGYFLLRGVPQGHQVIQIDAPSYEHVFRFAEVGSEQQTVTLKLAELQPKSEAVTMIGAAGGTHYANDGSFLKIPAGALDQTVPVQFTQLTGANALPQLPQDGYFLAFARLGPAGLTFKKPATLYLPLQPGIVLPVGTPIRISYYDERQGQWVQDITSGVITSIDGKLFLEYEINHFSVVGGQGPPAFPSNPVSGRVVFADGSPAAGVATDFGVTDADGHYSGSITGSGQDRDVSSYANNITSGGSVKARAGAKGAPVVFPDIVLPNRSTIIIPPPNFKKKPAPCTSAPTTLANPQISALNMAQAPEVNQSLYLKSEVSGFAASFLTGEMGNIDPSTIHVTLNGSEFFGSSDVQMDGRIIGININEADLKTEGRKYAISISARNKGGQVFTKAVEYDVAAKIVAADVSVMVLDDAQIPASVVTPIIGESAGAISYVYRQSDVVNGLVSAGVPVQALDDQGKSLDIKPNQSYGLMGGSNYSGSSASFVNGVARPQILIDPTGTSTRLTGLQLYPQGTPSSAARLGNNIQAMGLSALSNCGPKTAVRVENEPKLNFFDRIVATKIGGAIGDFLYKVDKTAFCIKSFCSSVGDATTLGWSLVPYASDVSTLLNEGVNKLTGKGVNPVVAGLAVGGLALQLSGGGLPEGEFTNAMLGIFKVSTQSGNEFIAKFIESIVKDNLNHPELAVKALQDNFSFLANTLKDGGPEAIKTLERSLSNISDEFGRLSNASSSKLGQVVTQAASKAFDAGLPQFADLAEKVGAISAKIPKEKTTFGDIIEKVAKSDAAEARGAVHEFNTAINLDSSGVKIETLGKKIEYSPGKIADIDVGGTVGSNASGPITSYAKPGEQILDQVKASANSVSKNKVDNTYPQIDRLAEYSAQQGNAVPRLVLGDGGSNLRSNLWDYVTGKGIIIVDVNGVPIPRPVP